MDTLTRIKEGLKAKWSILNKTQRLSLLGLLFLVAALPIGITLVLNPTNPFSRAFFPATPPISVPITSPYVTPPYTTPPYYTPPIYTTPIATPTPTASPIVLPFNPDVDRNGCTGRADVQKWAQAYLGTTSTNTFPDINNDGRVDLLDFNDWFIAMRTLPSEQICHTTQ